MGVLTLFLIFGIHSLGVAKQQSDAFNEIFRHSDVVGSGATRKYDFVLLTEDYYVVPPKADKHVLLLEDAPLMDALRLRGFSVTRKSWKDGSFDWSQAKAVIPRSCWDYMEDYEAWLEFLETLEVNGVASINTIDHIRWSMFKDEYMDHLEEKGVNIPKRVVVYGQSNITLRQIINENGWEEMIIKPSFSAISYETYRVTNENASDLEKQFQWLLMHEDTDMIAQPFQYSVLERGEIAVMVIGGKATHAVQKIPLAGDFRVQDDFGGKVLEHTLTEEEASFAHHVVSAIEPMPAYARVDIFEDNEGKLALMELEMIEPELFFRYNLNAADLLAEHILHTLKWVDILNSFGGGSNMSAWQSNSCMASESMSRQVQTTRVNMATKIHQEKLIVILLPFVGILLFIGLCSGYISSPLYRRNEHWPKWYQAFQVILLVLTLIQLDYASNNKTEVLFLHDLLEVSSFLGTDLHSIFSQEGGNGFVHEVGGALMRVTFFYLFAKEIEKLEDRTENEKKQCWIGFIFLRNFILFMVLIILFAKEDIQDRDMSLLCEKINPDEDFFPTMDQMKQAMIDFTEAWKRFHPAYLWGVRVSHAFIYPTILLVLTRRRWSQLFMWFIFIWLVDYWQMLADMTHYASGPALADERIEFQEAGSICYPAVHTLQTILAYPLNFVYLTTGYSKEL